MAHKMLIRTQKGGSGSLKKAVKIVFTLTPIKSEGVTYDPLFARHMEFSANSEESREFGWNAELSFAGYEYHRLRGMTDQVTDCRHAGSDSVKIMPGHTREMTAARGLYRYWSAPTYNASNPTSVVVINKTGSPSKVILLAKLDHVQHRPSPIVAYHNLENAGRIVASVALELQAYAVEFSMWPDLDGIMTPEHLTRPLFPAPIPCSDIPPASTWTLSQRNDGELVLRNDDHQPELSTYMAKLMDEMRSQVAGVLKCLGDTQKRLDVMEKSVMDNQVELSTVQRLVETAQGRLDRLDRTLPQLEGQAKKLDVSLTRSAERLASVEKSVAQAREEFALGKKSTTEAWLHISEKSSNVASAFEAKTEKLAESVRRTQDDVSNVQKSFFVTHNQLSDINTSVIAHRDMLTDLTKHRVPTLEAKVNEKDTISTPGAQTRFPVGKPTHQAQESPAVLETIRSMQGQVAALGRQIPAVEAKSDKLTRAYGQTLENLSSVNKYLQTTRQQVAGLELKVPRLETKVEKLTATQVVNDDGLAVLTSRVTAVEERVDKLSDMAGPRRSPSFPSINSSPIMFPGQPSGTALGDVLARDPPWLSLPHPLDSDSSKP